MLLKKKKLKQTSFTCHESKNKTNCLKLKHSQFLKIPFFLHILGKIKQ